MAIPAWSVPSVHFVRRPSIRLYRISVSWTEPLSAWPMCRAPVTFGGGTAIEKFSSAVPAASGWNRPDSSQREKIRASASAGSQRVRSCRSLMRPRSLGGRVTGE